jgi:hypothetical protein
MPPTLIAFLEKQNGAILFSGALSIYGVHRAGQLLNRNDEFSRLPFNIETENHNWPPVNRKLFLAIGDYSVDGSQVCIDRSNSRLYLFQRGVAGLAKVPSCSWENIDEWIVGEVGRLSTMFDSRGKRVVDERLTVPHTSTSA